MFEVPPGIFKNWKVLDSDILCTHFLMNFDAILPMQQALEAVQNAGLADLLKTFDGCFNIRLVRGSKGLVSAHSYGLAIDINASENTLGQTSGGFYDHPDFVKCFTDYGWDFGGNFHGRKDPMHFSYCWE